MAATLSDETHHHDNLPHHEDTRNCHDSSQVLNLGQHPIPSQKPEHHILRRTSAAVYRLVTQLVLMLLGIGEELDNQSP